MWHYQEVRVKDSRKTHGFNWAKAYCKCSVEQEFDELREAFRVAVKEFAKAKAMPKFWLESPGGVENEFTVCSRPYGATDGRRVAVFTAKDSIIVTRPGHAGPVVLELTPFLNHDGKCRYRFKNEKGGGEWLRWQAVRSVFEFLSPSLKK